MRFSNLSIQTEFKQIDCIGLPNEQEQFKTQKNIFNNKIKEITNYCQDYENSNVLYGNYNSNSILYDLDPNLDYLIKESKLYTKANNILLNGNITCNNKIKLINFALNETTSNIMYG